MIPDLMGHFRVRADLSDRLRSLLYVSPEKNNELLSLGLTETEISTLGHPRKCSTVNINLEEDLEKLFDLGGIVSGGAALASLTGEFETKDVDVYFNDDVSFVKAYSLVHSNPYIDICLYYEDPCELHDMSVVRVNVSKIGFDIKSDCMTALETGVSDIYNKCVIYPDRTADRMIKYNQRLGMKYSLPSVLAFIAINNIHKNMAENLMKICIS